VDPAMRAASAEVPRDKNTSSAEAKKNGEDYVFKSKEDEKKFLDLTQEKLRKALFDVKRQHVGSVADLTRRAHDEQAVRLRKVIQTSAQLLSALPNSEDGVPDVTDSTGDKLSSLIAGESEGKIFGKVVSGLYYTYFPALAVAGMMSSKVRSTFSPVYKIMDAASYRYVNKQNLQKTLLTEFVEPYLATMRQASQTTLDESLSAYSRATREVVEKALEEERARYEAERQKKGKPPSQIAIVGALSRLSDLVAAEAGLSKLKEYMEETQSGKQMIRSDSVGSPAAE